MKDSKVRKQLKMKARTIKVLAFIPIIDTVFSIYYTLERRYSEASKKNSFRVHRIKENTETDTI